MNVPADFPTPAQLRAEAAEIRAHHPGIGYVATMYDGAADQIERLRKRNTEMARAARRLLRAWDAIGSSRKMSRKMAVEQRAEAISALRAALEGATE